jgi:hypothetical protein
MKSKQSQLFPAEGKNQQSIGVSFKNQPGLREIKIVTK